jgi:hypothetical protein
MCLLYHICVFYMPYHLGGLGHRGLIHPLSGQRQSLSVLLRSPYPAGAYVICHMSNYMTYDTYILYMTQSTYKPTYAPNMHHKHIKPTHIPLKPTHSPGAHQLTGSAYLWRVQVGVMYHNNRHNYMHTPYTD